MATGAVNKVAVKGDGISLSKLVWRIMKRQPAGFVEAVLATNPGLAALGEILPVGTIIAFPLDFEDPSSSAAAVSLWD